MRSIGGCCLSLAVAMLTGLTLADDPVSVEAVRFTGFDGCSSDQQKKIEQAFDDAIDMSNYVYNKVDFSGQAEEEFFGPQYYNKDAQDNIKSNPYPFPCNFRARHQSLKAKRRIGGT